LHIYDVFGALEKVNTFMKPVGSGAFHAAVEAYGKEWSYGWAAEGSEGIYWSQPRSNDRHRYRESVKMGGTALNETEVIKAVLDMKHRWRGCEYDILVQNCCHFSDALCRTLGVGPAPEWVLHLAGAGAALASGVEQAVVRTHAAAEVAAAKACEFDEHYHLSERAEKFLSQEVQVDEAYIGAKAQDLWSKAIAQLAPMGAYAERVIDEALKPISEDRLELVESRARELLAAPSAARPSASRLPEGPQGLWQRWWRRGRCADERERRIKVVACHQPVVGDWSPPRHVKQPSPLSSLECSPIYADDMTAEEVAAACEALAARPSSPCTGACCDSPCDSPLRVVQLRKVFSDDEEEPPAPAAVALPPPPQLPLSPVSSGDECTEATALLAPGGCGSPRGGFEASEQPPQQWTTAPQDFVTPRKEAAAEAAGSPSAPGATPLPLPSESALTAMDAPPVTPPPAVGEEEAEVAGDNSRDPLVTSTAASVAGALSRAISGAAPTIRTNSTTSNWSMPDLWGRVA